jgi:hypothetical protein
MAPNILDSPTRKSLFIVAALLLSCCLACVTEQSESEQSRTQAPTPSASAEADATPEVIRAASPAEDSASVDEAAPVETPADTSAKSEEVARASAAPPQTTSGSTTSDSTKVDPSYLSPSVPPSDDEPFRGREAKRYLQMSDSERREFIERRAKHVSRMISSGTYEFTDDAITYIKQYVDAYAKRVGNRSNATWGEDLNFVFARAQRYSPAIIRAFNGRRVPPAIGLYLVAVETEYTNFSSDNFAGAAGLFQFIGPTAEAYGVPRGERTNVEKMAPAAASYVSDRIAEFGTDPMSVALGIAGYNRSPDSVRNDLRSVMNSKNKERSFWTLVANSDKLDHWFQGENIKYVPKFFAAAIVGETPWAFGLQMKQPLSTQSEPSGDAQRVAARGAK